MARGWIATRGLVLWAVALCGVHSVVAGTTGDSGGGGTARHTEPVRNDRVPLSGGRFWLGTDKPFFPADGEGPAVLTTVPPFLIDRLESSNDEFAAFVDETGYATDAERFGWSFVHKGMVSEATLAGVTQQVASVPWWLPVTGADWRHPEGPDSDVLTDGRGAHPVVHVSHADALAFCQWKGGRLPTEAEFEYAARGGKHNRTYAWGNKFKARGRHRANTWQGKFPEHNTAADGCWGPCPVTAFGSQNRYGLFNVVGNVWEWVLDPWSVDRSRAVGPGGALAAVAEAEALRKQELREQGPQAVSSDERVKKGGSYMCHKSYCFRYRVAARSHNTADSTAANLGVRCAYDVESNSKGATASGDTAVGSSGSASADTRALRSKTDEPGAASGVHGGASTATASGSAEGGHGDSSDSEGSCGACTAGRGSAQPTIEGNTGSSANGEL